MSWKQSPDIVENHSPNDIIQKLENITLYCPTEQKTTSKLFIKCNNCKIPITFEKHVMEDIKNENNIPFGIVIGIKKLFKTVEIMIDNPWDTWQTHVSCFNCGSALSFLYPKTNGLSDSDFYKLCNYKNKRERSVILCTKTLVRNSDSTEFTPFEIKN